MSEQEQKPEEKSYKTGITIVVVVMLPLFYLFSMAPVLVLAGKYGCGYVGISKKSQYSRDEVTWMRSAKHPKTIHGVLNIFYGPALRIHNHPLLPDRYMKEWIGMWWRIFHK